MLFHKAYVERLSKPDLESSFNKDFNLTGKDKIEAHKNFLLNPIPQTNDIKSRNSYNRMNEVEKKLNETIREGLVFFVVQNTLAQHLNNFTDVCFPSFGAGNNSIITFSKEKAVNPPTNIEYSTVLEVSHRLEYILFRLRCANSQISHKLSI